MMLLTVLGAAVFAEVLAPHHPLVPTGSDPLTGPSTAHPMGTDVRGRDVFSRVLHGARLTVSAAAAALGVAIGVGLALAAIGDRSAGRVAQVLRRALEVALVVPAAATALLLAFALGPGVTPAVLAVGLSLAPAVAHAAHGLFVVGALAAEPLAERPLGRRSSRRLPVVVMHSFGTAVLATATIDYLGLGQAAPAPAWGVMLSQGHGLLAEAWWLTVFPGAAVLLTVVGAMLVGDALALTRRDQTTP